MIKVGYIAARRPGNMIFLPQDIVRKNGSSLPGVLKNLEITAGFRKKKVGLTRGDFVFSVVLNHSVRFWVSISADFLEYCTRPIYSFSPRSDAVYYFQGIMKPDWGILVQKIPPLKETSCHYHTERDEWVFPLFGFGRAKNCAIGDDFPLLKREIIFFPRGIYHSLEAGKHHGLVTVIILKGVKTVEEILQSDHIFYQGAG